jgi:hypothetical protein
MALQVLELQAVKRRLGASWGKSRCRNLHAPVNFRILDVHDVWRACFQRALSNQGVLRCELAHQRETQRLQPDWELHLQQGV